MTSFPLTFTKPDLLLLLVALWPALWLMARHSLAQAPPWVRRLSLTTRAVIIGLLVASLAGARWVQLSDRFCALFLIDASDSARGDVDPEVAQRIRDSMMRMAPEDTMGIVVFGEEAMVDLSPSIRPRFERVESLPERRRTDLARALRLAAGLFPHDAEKRVILFSDGNENVGVAEREALSAATGGVRVDVIPIERVAQGELAVEQLVVPEREDVDKPFEIKATIRAAESGDAVIRLYRDGAFVSKTSRPLDIGKNVIVLQHAESESGFHTYEIEVETPADTFTDNNRGAAFTHVRGRSRALLVGEEDDTRYLADALRLDKVPVDVELSPPLTPARAQNFDAIVLANIPSSRLSDEQMRVLRSYVRDMGGGLAMIGGENSFGVGLYADTPIEEVLPVNVELKDKRDFPSLAMIMVIDKSGSMGDVIDGDVTKMGLANAAAVRAVELMTPRDRVGVVAFDEAAMWVQPVTDASRRQAISDQVFSIQPGGGTNLYPGLVMAVEALTAERAQIKHIIALTDGQTMPGDWDAILAAMRERNITLSTVAVGVGADQTLLSDLAAKGLGRFHVAIDPRNTPSIFSKETMLVQKSYLVEQPFTPAVAQVHDILKGVGSLPDLQGYVVTEPKPSAQVLLKSSVPEHDEPILAIWRHGLGKGLAFTSDAKNKWAADWIGADAYSKIWSQQMRWLMRDQRPGALHPKLTIDGDRARLVVDAIDDKNQSFVNFLDLTATVVTPDFETLTLPLSQSGPGQYETEFDAPETGAYIATVVGPGESPATVGDVIAYPPEYRDLAANRFLLARLAEATGGRVDPPTETWFEHSGQIVRTARDIWYPLALIALLLVPVDVALRRLRLDPEQWAFIGRAVARYAPFIGFRRHAMSTENVAALKRRKRSVEERLDGSATLRQTPEPDQAPSSATSTFIRGDVAERLNVEPTVRPQDEKRPDARPNESKRATSTSRLLAAKRKAREERERSDG